MPVMKDPVERALLCTLFLDRGSAIDALPVLRPEMFADPYHGLVYRAFMAVYDRGEQPDLVLTELEMRKIDFPLTEKMGGVSYFSDGMEVVRLEYNAKEYAREIRRKYVLKCLHQVCKCTAAESLQFDADCLLLMDGCEQEFMRLRGECTKRDSLVSLYQLGQESVAYLLDRMNKKEDTARILTGIIGVDGIAGGFYRQELVVIGGLPSDGKTALSTFIAMHMACKGKHVLHFSFEMTGHQTMSRFFAGYAGVEADRLRIGGLQGEDVAKIERYVGGLEDMSYYFENSPSMTVNELRAQVLLRKQKRECDVVLVDYLHTLAPSPAKNETQEMVIRTTIRKLKDLAMEADCVMIVVSQLNREIIKRADKGYVPQMSDLRDSGAIEYIADNVMIISRPERFGVATDGKGKNTSHLLKLYMLKNRCGATGVAEVYRNDTFTYFTNPGNQFEFDGTNRD